MGLSQESIINLSEIQALVGLYQIHLPEKKLALSYGEQLGKASGSSLDFQDHRNYFLGDDIRHIDWRAYGRTDQLIIKKYHEEISPQIDVVIDCSMSMGQSHLKWQRYQEIALFLHFLGKADHFQIRVWSIGAKPMMFNRDLESHIIDMKLEPGDGLASILKYPPALRKNSIRIVLSDFMIEENLDQVLDFLGRDSSFLFGVQLLDEFELNPSTQGGLKLVDSESSETLNLRLNESVIKRYKERLQNHLSAIQNKILSFSGILFTEKYQLPLDSLVQKISQNSHIIRARN